MVVMTDDEIIAVVQAHKEGKKIEVRKELDNGTYYWVATDPAWNFSVYCYRVAIEPRKPREWYLHGVDQGPISVYDASTNRHCSICVLVREVIG